MIFSISSMRVIENRQVNKLYWNEEAEKEDGLI
jgi:hypothetical protein